MKRLPALLALVAVLMLGTAGMAPASTLTFDVGENDAHNYIPPSGSPIDSVTDVKWSDDGGGHLYCNNFILQNIISFTTPTIVNSFQMTGLRWGSDDPVNFTFGPMDIKAFKADGVTVAWSTTVNFAQENPDDPDYSDWANWLTVEGNTAAVSKIIFYGPDSYGADFFPSIDNLVITEADPVPVPASVWLLVSGLLGLVGLRRKLTC